MPLDLLRPFRWLFRPHAPLPPITAVAPCAICAEPCPAALELCAYCRAW